MLLMHRPLPAKKAYALLGTLLGTFPPAAIFLRMFNYGFSGSGEWRVVLLLMFVAMNVVCCLVGRRMGSLLGQQVDELRRASWTKALLIYLCMGFAWGIVTGAAGGVLFFVFGAYFGALCASLVGTLAFALFGPLHRLLARGGMIDARQLWPLACGITGVIVALILGL